MSMHALRNESLNLYNSGRAYNQFYYNNIIECRILKESQSYFTLIIQNVSNKPLIIDYY